MMQQLLGEPAHPLLETERPELARDRSEELGQSLHLDVLDPELALLVAKLGTLSEVAQRHRKVIGGIAAPEFRKARKCLERAVIEEPGYSYAWSRLAFIYIESKKRSIDTPPDWAQLADDASNKAILKKKMTLGIELGK